MTAADDAVRALETTEKVIAALTLMRDRDAAIDGLIAHIEEDRALLLASMTGGHALKDEPARPRRAAARRD